MTDYYKTLETAVPAGYAVNPNIAITTTFMCCKDEQEAIDKGTDGAHFFGVTTTCMETTRRVTRTSGKSSSSGAISSG